MMTKTNNIEEACRFSNAAAALSVLKKGAQLGMPTKKKSTVFFLSNNLSKKIYLANHSEKASVIVGNRNLMK